MFESELSSALSTVWVRTAERVLHRSTLAEMVEPLADQAAEMVLCVSCSDAVPAGVRCATSGAAGQGAVTAPDVDEALLDQVGVALAAHAALARRTATRRVETASRLYEEAVVLRSRLRRQAALLRARLDERRGLLPAVVEALDRVEEALAQARGPEDVGGPWILRARLPRNPTCPAIARRLFEESAREELGQQEAEDAMLIVSELVTNAFVHADGPITLIISQEKRGDGGYGLFVVQQLASTWGAADGTGHVWAELAISA